MNSDKQNPDSDVFGRWLMPALCVVMAIALAYLTVQNFSLKGQLAEYAETFSMAQPAFADRTGDDAVSFAAYLPDGQEFMIRTDSLAAPLIFAWLSYDCEPCVLAMEKWNLLAEDYPGQVWGVVRRESEVSDSVFHEQFVGFPIVEPISDSVFGQYRVQATPQTMIISEDGIIAGVWYGPLGDEALDRIAELMQQPFVERR